MAYTPKLSPYPYQQALIDDTWDREGWALFLKPGLGKTAVVLHSLGLQVLAGRADALLVISPNTVKRVWLEEAEKHFGLPFAGMAYDAKTASTARGKRAFQELLETEGAVPVLAMNYEAILTKRGREAAEKFLGARKCVMVLDEAHRIKSPQAKTTKALNTLARKAPFRRVLTGTPVANSPTDVYTLMRWLYEKFWHPWGISHFNSFRTQFCVMEDLYLGSRKVPKVVGYQRLDKLHEIVKQCSTHLGKEVLGLPPKVFSRRYFAMEPEQRRAYEAVRDQILVELEALGAAAGRLAITRLVRLQQIASGWVKREDGTLAPAAPKNPRLAALKEELENDDSPAVIWCRFTQDVEDIMRELGVDARRIDGKVEAEDRNRSIEDFQAGRVKYLVANLSVSEGWTATRAGLVVYYSGSYSLIQREQSEDRCHRVGQDKSVRYVDLIGEGTIDEKIVEAIEAKVDLASAMASGDFRRFL